MNAEALIQAIERGDYELTESILDEGADLNTKSVSMDVFGSYVGVILLGKQLERTPLMYASLHGHLDIAYMLLDRGANPLIKAPVSAFLLLSFYLMLCVASRAGGLLSI